MVPRRGLSPTQVLEPLLSSTTRSSDWRGREGRTPTGEFLRPVFGCGDGPLLTVSGTFEHSACNPTYSPATFATASSTRVTNSVTGLKPDILAILDKLVDNKPGFTSVGVVNIVKANLQSLRNLTNVLSTEIQAKVTTADKATIASGIVEALPATPVLI
ncbi:cell wall mannoprotein 1 family protein [Aspergillus homomorphus CBS 101889]|uniref:Uncharacterized protein n=1 Tax=Aspergillus homomorphus (strain CBS 101889) TaxID=1450537 RepID=A0A395HJ90_ASPHC|nr:hypothetical protein BO97DRAFT_429765 [Aspergillus homomorphus CBS 101889]RAL06968.1 hypothetical protein BO97DRAFT_429765 [Aspergillus homomorphus CBS 101889]